MRVETKDLQAGCILTEDVYSMTNHPIIEKQTILTGELIQILNLFLIPNVKVDKTLVNGTPYIPEGVVIEEEDIITFNHETKDLTKLFLQATQKYKKEFQLWQSGLPIDISKIRLLLLPLLDETIASTNIFSLHRLSNQEEYLYQHAVAVGLFCGYIARKLNYPKGEVIQAALAGILSDSGMSKVSPAILQKRVALTPREFEEVINHSKYSYQMVQHVSLLKESTKIAIFQHHERLDGSGYPFGLKSNKIHEVAKIIAVADTYHAMTSERLYRGMQSPFRVLEMMRQDFFGKFDLSALEVLGVGMMNLSIGSKIKLSNGQIGEVIFATKKSPTRPLIKLIGTEQIINLEENRNLFIEEIIQ